MNREKFIFLLLSLTTLLSVLYFSLEINSWKFSFVGDEWSFYELPKQIAEKNLLVNPFDTNGVYSEHRVMGSFYQAIFLKLLGYSNFSWRISNIILIIPITIFLFLFLKKAFNTHIALISALIMQSSFYLANFFKIGYINPQALTLFVISLFCAYNCGANPSKKNIVILAVVLGLSFYVYIGPLFPLLIWPYLLPLLSKRRKTKDKIYSFLLMTSVYLVVISLSLSAPVELKGANKTVFSREFDDNSQIVINIYRNFLLFYKNFGYSYNHFVVGPYLDIISRILAFIGTIIVILKFRKKEYLFLLLSYISTCVIIGLTSPYSYAPTTRGVFFLPFGFVFAGIALERITKIFSLRVTFLIIPLIFILNLYQSQIGVFKETGYTGTALVIKSLQEAKENNSKRKIVLLLSDYSGYNYQNIYTMQQAYGLEKITFEAVISSKLRCSVLEEAHILIFDNDFKAKHAISNLTCPLPNNFSIKMLTPNIYL